VTSKTDSTHENTYKDKIMTQKQIDDKVIRALTRADRRKQGSVMTGESSHTHLGSGDNPNKRLKVSNNEQENNTEQHIMEETETQEDPTEKDIMHTIDGHTQVDIESLQQIAEYQRKDRTWDTIIKHMNEYSQYWATIENENDLPSEVLATMTTMDKHVYTIYKEIYSIDQEGVLRKKKYFTNRGMKTELQTICIPVTMKKSILRHFHGSPLTGHLGIAKVLPLVNKRYHWPGLTKDVKRWVKGCATCQKRKQHRRNNYGTFKSKISEFPWERACMDLVGPLPESDNHNRYILTIVDTFSRWPIAIPLPNKETSVIAEAIYKNLICIHGCPKELFSDQENNLMAEAIRKMCETLGIKRLTSSCYAPWQNGHVERFHRFLGASLSMYASRKKKDWDKWLDCVLFTYRVSVHAQTGESPYKILYNRDPILGADLITQSFPGTENETPTDEISKEMLEWFKILADKQRKISGIAMEKKNKNRKEPKFQKDDWILIYEPPVTHTTLKRHWKVPRKFQDVLTGPHRITGEVKNAKGEWMVYHTRRKKEENIHISRIVKYNPWSDDILDTAKGSMVPGHDIRQAEVIQEQDLQGIKEQHNRDGDNVYMKEFVAVATECDTETPLPFLIAKVTDLGPLATAEIHEGLKFRKLNGRVYGNAQHNPKGVLRHGWMDNNNKFYFKAKSLHNTHRPLMLSCLNNNWTTYRVVLAGFELNANETLSQNILDTLRASAYLSWGEYKGDKL